MSVRAGSPIMTDAAHESWYHAASRWMQLAFVEDDPLHFDLDAWRDVMIRTKSNAICVSAGGYIAFYPTKVPFHYTSKFLGSHDLFGEVVDAARTLGMKVMARVDPHAIHADAAAAHPEWLARKPDGRPIEHSSQRDIWITCPFSTYHSEFLTDVARELVRDYDIDGVFANRWEGPLDSLSYSDAARRSFRAETGLELPVDQPRTDRVWKEYVAWRGRQLGSLISTWDEAVRDINPVARFIPNRGPFQLRSIDPAIIDRATPALFIDKQGRSGGEAIWAAGRVGRRSKGAYPDRPVNLITSVGPEHEARWKDSVDSPAELITAIADGILHEANPWFTKFNARIVDDRWVAPVAYAFGLHEAVEKHYRASVARPDVLLLEGTAGDESDPSSSYTATFPDEAGLYQAMLEARIPFGFIPDFRLTPDRLDGVKLVIIPDAQSLSDQHVTVLQEFVERGGSLIATDRSSLVDADGSPRSDFALSDVLGVNLIAPRRDRVKNNYIAITEAHDVSSGFDGAARILGGTAIVPIRAAEDAVVPFRFIPDFPDLPMEEVYARRAPDAPAIVCRTHPSGGRTAYAAFNLGAVHWDALQLDHGRLIANIIEWALSGERRVHVEGVGLVDIAVRERDGGLLVGLVNLDNPMAMRGQLHWLRALDAQTLRVRLPADAAGADVHLVIADVAVQSTVIDGDLIVELPPTEVLELVDIRWHAAPSRTAKNAPTSGGE